MTVPDLADHMWRLQHKPGNTSAWQVPASDTGCSRDHWDTPPASVGHNSPKSSPSWRNLTMSATAWDQCWPRDIVRLVSLGATLINAGLCSDAGLRLPSVTRQSFGASGLMAEKEFVGDVTSGTRMPVYAKWTGGVVQMPWIGLQYQRIITQIWSSGMKSWAQLCYPSWSELEVVLCSSMITSILMWLVYAPISWWRMRFTCYHGLPSVPTWIPSKMCEISWACAFSDMWTAHKLRSSWGLHR